MPRPVLYLARAPFFSGAERALVLTLESLRHTDYEPVVIAGTDGEFAECVRAMGVPCRVLPLDQLSGRRPIMTGWSVARVIAAAVRVRPALIHANDMPSYQAGGYAARLLGVPAVTHLRFPDSAAGYRWFFRPRFAHAIFISEAFQTDASALAPDLFTGRSTVVYDAVKAPRAWTEVDRQAKRLELGLPLDSPVIALTGQIAEVKGIWDFIAAANLLRDINVTFAVLGDDLRTRGELRQRMEQEVERLGLRDKFRFLGFRPNAPDLIPVFDIIAVPSHVEPFGLASLEAMAAARPVVATRVGGIPEVVRDGITGLLVPAKDPSAMAAALASLLAEPARCVEMGARGRDRAREVFSLEGHATALAALYDRVLASRA